MREKDESEAEELKRLRAVVGGMERAVRKLADGYVKNDFYGRIELGDFFDLVIQRATEMGRNAAVEALLRREVQARMEKIAKGYAEADVRKTVFIPVLITPINKRDAGLAGPKKYRAFSVRGNLPRAFPAPTPEAAYEHLRPGLLDHFSAAVHDIMTVKTDLMEKWDEATYLREDVVAGIRVIVKVLGAAHAETEAGEAPAAAARASEVHNEFSRSVRNGKCAICGWEAWEQPEYDPDFLADFVAIHFAKRHPGELPYDLVSGAADYLIRKGRA
jgi:hypothetical protein